MLKNICWVCSAGFALMLVAGLAWAEEAPPVMDIVSKANHMAYYQGQDGRARVKMHITDQQGRERNKEFTILRKDLGEEDTEQKFYVYFHRPADERGTVFMVWKHIGQDDDRWLYLPALDVTKRIAASDERTSFVGSDFYYEDVSGRGIHEDEHELAEVTENYYVVKSLPKKPELVEFDHYLNYVHKESFIPVKTEYYREDGNKYRQMTVLQVEDIQGFTTITQQQMEDLDAGRKTVITYDSVEYNLGLPEDIFTERYLRRAPRKYLR
ncbi:MAG: outer membrane lipoprotein-sorting protein [Desulfovermiculus sp.]|nr:outer membrane lipoprotein-sorting protein [Desulfovermiculus sp.]